MVEAGVDEEDRVAQEESRKDMPPTAALVRLPLLQGPDQLLLLLGVHGDEIVRVVATVAPLPPSPRSHRRPSPGLKLSRSFSDLA